MTEWIFSIGIVVFGVILCVILAIIAAKADMDSGEVIGLVLLVLFLVSCVFGVHEIIYGGGKIKC